MTTQEFLGRLESFTDKALVFDYGSGQIKPGYHVTEVMNAGFHSMDCGGVANSWQQTIIQLMGPNRLDKAEYMSISKFLSIYRRVASSVAVQAEAELRFEYGDASLPAIHYHVESIEDGGDYVTVLLSQPGVTCKASDRRIRATTCCESSVQVATKALWGDSVRSNCCG